MSDIKEFEDLSGDELSENEEIDDIEEFDGDEVDIDEFNNKCKFFVKKGDAKKNFKKIYRMIAPRFLQVYQRDPSKKEKIFTADRMAITFNNTQTKNLVRIRVKDLTNQNKPNELVIKFESIVE